MAGRFKLGENGRIEIDCQGQGALFLEAECDNVVDDFGDYAPGFELLKLVPMVDYSLGIESYPLLVSQVTYFKCGGVSLGVASHHYVADGPSAFHFINTWSNMANGLTITIPPLLDRTLLCAQDPPQPVFEHTEYHPNPNASSPLQVEPNEIKTVCSIFKVTQNQLNMLKEKSKEVEGNTTGYNSFESLSGHVWKCVCEARELPYDVETKLHIPTDGRARLQPPIPQGYFGNVIFTTVAKAIAGDINSQPMWYATSKIHDALVMMNNDYLKSTINYMEQNLDQKPKVSYKYTDLRIISWARLPIHDADFGWGRPIFTSPVWIPSGYCFVLPNLTKDGSLSIVIGLEAKHMKLFSKLWYAI
ncbi:shikimate O-hydroxycinnamoyltransferase-like [Bidens hawaiensis]|uniref:shikimate O-hydroxycinnamoyltransferase-like n=1 Tax=Bidens hawaiensis TaxID=980011 RepID=UPI00404A1BEA